jgi:hypothetical protein
VGVPWLMEIGGFLQLSLQSARTTPKSQVKDFHTGFENRDYILHFKEEIGEQGEVRKKLKEN